MNKLYTCSVNGDKPVSVAATSAPDAKTIYAAQMGVPKSRVSAVFDRNLKPQERAADILKPPAAITSYKAGELTVYVYKTFHFTARYYTHEELVKIDENLPLTGSSQEAGFYWDDYDEEAGAENGVPAGPFASVEEAKAAWIQIAEKIL